MKKRNILVFPCGSEIGLDIYNSIKYSTHFHLIGASSTADHGQFVYTDYISGLPFLGMDLIPYLVKIVKERQVDAIYPTMDSVITLLKEHEAELGCPVISSPLHTVKTCLSKRQTYLALSGIIDTPVVYDALTVPDNAFPIFAKPDIGYGARGTKLLHTRSEMERFLAEQKEDVLLLEYLPGEEFTVDCFTDKDGKLLYSAGRKRNRIKNGISVNTFFLEDQSIFNELAKTINQHLKFRGAWFYQVKCNSQGNLCLLEVASRIGGSSLLSCAVGVNLALLSLFDTFGFPVNIVKNNYRVELDRALGSKYKMDLSFDSVYCDYDDCLILDNNQLNVQLVSFLYQCVNEKMKLFLLTKHEASDLRDELKHFRIDNLFDEIIRIEKTEDKALYISADNPIFIDDSHSERANVKAKLSIPVFSPDMIDTLLQ